MKIIILGAGQVGGALAEHLANEQNDITWWTPTVKSCACCRTGWT